MTFQRSPSSLSSLVLFYRVDVVVFCEGGPSRTVADALSLTLDGRTLDGIYWSNVVDALQIPKNFHFKSVGDKGTLKKIAENVASTGCVTVTVCLDADYDVHIGAPAPYARVALTYGYSWESDVLHLPVLERVVHALIGPPPPQLLDDIQRAVSRLAADLLRWCEIDIALRARARACVFDRDKPLSVVDFSVDPPWISLVALRQRLAAGGYRRGPRRLVALSTGDVLQIAYGKLTSKLIYHLIVHFAKKIMPKMRVDYDMFMRIAISETFNLMRSGHLRKLSGHIQSQRSAFA